MNHEFAKRFAELRKIMCLSIFQMSLLCHYSASYLCDLEHGVATPSNEMMSAVCSTFHVNREWLETGNGSIFYDDEGAQVREHKIEAAPERLKELREARKLNYKEFSKMVGVNAETYRNLEQGTRLLTERQAKKIANACDIGIDWLLYGEENAKEYPLNEDMVAYLQQNPELRKAIREKMQTKNLTKMTP